MHDPLTQAFVIPWRYRTERFKHGSAWRYWVPLVTIWHKDPEGKDNDDSCGWFRPPSSEKTRDIVKSLAGDEARDPWFMALDAKSNPDPVLCERLIFGAFMLVSLCLHNRGVIWRRVSCREAERWAAELVHNPIDNFRSSLCFKSGYHSNWYRDGVPNSVEDDKFFREGQAKGFFGAITGYILRQRRPWYRHPRWHIWHWQIQVHPVQSFKRWAFSRCSKCGGRFRWGYYPTTGDWYQTGPLWFRSEKGAYHRDCRTPDHECCAESKSQGVP